LPKKTEAGKYNLLILGPGARGSSSTGDIRCNGEVVIALNDCISDIVEEPPIQRICPYSSSASCPNDSLTSSSVLMGVEGSESCSFDPGAGANAVEITLSGPEAVLAVAAVEFAEGPSCSRTGAI